MTDDIQARAAAIIHNESDLYLREAKKVAAALAEAGVLTNTDGRARLRLANDLTGALEALNAARAELATVREEWAKTENALYAAHDENINLKNRLLVRYRELDEANSRAHDAEVELARAEADREHWKEAAELAAAALVNEKGHHENTRKAWRADEADIRAELAEVKAERDRWRSRYWNTPAGSWQARAEKAEAERESLRRQVAAVAKKSEQYEEQWCENAVLQRRAEKAEAALSDAERRGAERGWDEGYTKGTSAVWFDETVNPYRLTEGDD